MHKQDLLFYNEYEQFYAMTENSEAFKLFCKKAFGQDFSQDGFSDVAQIERVIEYIPQGGHILDIGCGNGKMLGYLQEKTGAVIHGFDYSENAIGLARNSFKNGNFVHGCIGEVDYPAGFFDVVTSMDTMYFAPDMPAFVDQIMRWLKKGGTFFALYQEGDVMPKTDNANTTVLAKAFLSRNIPYEVKDITKESYDLLIRKRKAAQEFEEMFKKEGNGEWFDTLVWQTEYVNRPFEEYSKQLARYVYVVKK